MKLICPECRRENEPERIYCHDCGARLDRSGLSKAQRKEEDPAETQRRLRQMLSPHGAKLRRQFFQGSKLVLGAVALAAMIQMVRSPDLPPPGDSAMLPPQINLDLENAATDPRVGALRYTDEQVNAYLAYALKGKQAALSKYLTFERAVARFDEGFLGFTVQRSLFGLPLSTTGLFAPAAAQSSTTSATYRGGSIGRMPIHPALMKYAAFLFSDVWAALDRERKSLGKLGPLEFHPKSVFIAPKNA